MFSKRIMAVGFLAAITLVSLGHAARADNINTSGNVCHALDGFEITDIEYWSDGVMNSAGSARDVVCALPRSPLTTAGPGSFYVDGVNFGGSTTSCTLFVYTYFHQLVSATTFTEPVNPGASVTWDHLVSVPSLGVYDYVSLMCALPGTPNGAPVATLLGVTSVQ